MNFDYVFILVSALYDEVQALSEKYDNIEPVVLDVGKSKEKLAKLIDEHDLVIRFVLII